MSLAAASIFIPNWSDLRPFVAEVWLIAAVVAVLLTPFFVRKSNTACAAVALGGILLGIIGLLVVGPAETSSAHRFAAMLVSDGVAWLWKILLLLFVGGIVLMWYFNAQDDMHEGDGPEYFTLLLCATLGMALMASASNLLMLFIAVELASLPSYVLAGFRKTDKIGAEASLKYVLFGAAASSVMVYGLSLLYGLYGTLQLYPTAAGDGLATLAATKAVAPGLLALGLVALLAGLAFKISAVPFHFWAPDVFEGSGIEVTTFLSVASKGAGLVLLARFALAIADASAFAPTGLTMSIAAVIGVMGAVTSTVANTAAYWQTNVKRLLAYSSIAHAGYMMCAASLLLHRDPAGRADLATAGSQALLLYLAVYLFMNLGAFAVAALVERETGSRSINGFTNLGRRSPLLAFSMVVCLVSLVGLPPVAGFAAKLNLMLALGRNGGGWWALVAVIVLNTAISLYYYARILKAMYLQPGPDDRLTVNPIGRGITVACSAVLILLFILWSPLDRLTRSHAKLHSAKPDRPAVASVEK